MRMRPALALLLSTLFLNGCVAAILPIAAAGMMGKKQLDDANKRARAAEASLDQAPAPPPVQAAAAIPPALPAPDTLGTLSPLDRLNQSGISNAYLPFARYSITMAEKARRGESIFSAILVDKVSLASPKTLPCFDKPMLAIIDLDLAPGTPSEMEIERQTGLSSLIETMRESGIRIAWLAEAGEDQLAPMLDLLRSGDDAVLRDADLLFFGHSQGFRKQERRWQLARDHCVVAIAGDQKSDFDELYDFLREPNYAIRLDAFMGRGWFELPHPVTAIDSERLLQAPEPSVTIVQPEPQPPITTETGKKPKASKQKAKK